MNTLITTQDMIRTLKNDFDDLELYFRNGMKYAVVVPSHHDLPHEYFADFEDAQDHQTHLKYEMYEAKIVDFNSKVSR